MPTLENASHAGYTNEYNKPIGNDIDKWFEYGVKTIENPAKQGIFSRQQTLYILVSVIGFIILVIVIMVPVIVGMANKH